MVGSAGYRRRGGGILPPRLSWPRIRFLLLLLIAFAGTSEQCPEFRFPSLNPNLVVTAQEHSVVTIPYRLDACPSRDNDTLYTYVSRDPKRKPAEGDYCIVRMMSGKCDLSYNDERCPCGEENGEVAIFTKNVSVADNGIWVWRTGLGTVRAEVVFDIRRSPHSDGGIPSTPAPTVSKRTLKRVRPSTTQVSAGDSNPGGHTAVAKITGGNNKETVKEKTKDDNDDDEDEKSVDGSVTTGVIVGMVNVVTIIVVVVVVFVLVRRHSKKTSRDSEAARRHPRESLPPLPNSARLPGLRSGISSEAGNKYSTILSVTSSHYEVLPEGCQSPAVDKDGYLEPETAKKEDVKDDYIELV